MKNRVRLVLGLALCFLSIVLVIGCDDGGGGGGGGSGNVEASLASGNEALKNEDYDAAIAHYKAAYNADRTNPKAITYSVLAELAAISIDPKVKELATNRLGVVNYPGTMGALFTTDWMTEYKDQDFVREYLDESGHYVYWVDWWDPGSGIGYYYYSSGYVFVSGTKKYETESEYYPGLTLPGWFAGTSVYKDSLISEGGLSAVQSTATFPLLMAANLLDKNTNGLNDLFNDILSSVFGSKFEELAKRVDSLRPDAAVTLDADVIAALGLDGLLEGDSLIIGKPELDILIAGLRISKATFELLASYDWNTNFSFAKFDWADQTKFKTELAKVSVSQLPFKNNFLNSQNQAMLNNAKNDYIAALSSISNVYDAIAGRDYIPPAAEDYLDDYRWIQDGVNKVRAAIQNNNTFWIPEELPSTGNTWNGTEANAMFGIDMGKLFTPGYLKLNEIVEMNGTNPVFYGLDASDQGVKINSLAQIDSYEVLGFKIKLNKIKDLVPKCFDDTEIYVPMFPTEIGKEIYKKYYPYL
jgi:hypothetical protein